MIDHIEREPRHDGFQFRHIVFTAHYDATDPSEFTVEGLRSRIAGFKAIWRAVWKKIKSPGSGAFVSLEIAGTGNVHVHALHFGPYLDVHQLHTVSKKAWSRAGHIKIAAVDGFEGAREVCKYSIKTPGGAAESWLKGDRAEIINPALAAAWEIAISGYRLQERYGLFRTVDRPSDTWDDPGDEDCACDNCGRVGAFSWRSMPLEIWIRWLHSIGYQALRTGAGRAPPKT